MPVALNASKMTATTMASYDRLQNDSITLSAIDCPHCIGGGCLHTLVLELADLTQFEQSVFVSLASCSSRSSLIQKS